ncbi:type VI secretion system contractile sheath small subunit [Rhizobium lentis]|uniref:Type VI secretion system protein ImpB n=1 Tax=Rhizobium binae TaxID=1138190 RepID=A0ABV2MR71_9HYPH|nr:MULTISPECIES: type VI secretion system contractile sheath small subunit [Rhizobium]NKL51972.1 type VI secretion system contractile sheath small subunit [Rhizobium leguminosarum bv. viciae]MBX4996162.1 type VI secretion system contractile sheath small subunit [Rhizobium binae]MBX5020597.1 type VI secretion system contractile sheath small subunit [Rhizobium lentis]MBX5087231.1 type VI secretion system contractile sheath small subunit [Rhizobium lentis]MBX5099975.1 type VI secretion system con
MAKASSQKFINRNRPPRVQIEYDLETYGSRKKVELPFVVGVMSDLAGNPAKPLPPVAERKMMEIDIDNFDDRLRSLKPRVAMRVPNRLTNEGQLAVDLTFESMDDFSPAAVARKVESLRVLLEARMELSNLLAYLDGKVGAEELIVRFLNNPALLGALSAPSESLDPIKSPETPPPSPDTKER